MIAATYRNADARAWRCAPLRGIAQFHATLPSYAATPLVDVPGLASELGVRRVLVKDESSRMGLPAFKILGASYAVSRALTERLAPESAPLPINDLRDRLRGSGITLVAATDGNHGRAVARMARLLGIAATIFFPATLTAEAKDAIAREGARTVELEGPYDDVVVQAAVAAQQAADTVLVQDTAWAGYQDVPQWIVDGYETLFTEADQQLSELGVTTLDLVAVPVGVGSLAQAAIRHYRSGAHRPVILSVEADRAPAILASLHAGTPTTVPTSHTIMAGLNCGTPSDNAWPYLQHGLDAAVAVSDDDAAQAVRDLAALGIDAGPCGAATLAGVRAQLRAEPLPADAAVLLLSTEGSAANPLPEHHR